MSEKYILYARKSTDVEDKQVLSIEAQLVELRAYAKNENLTIIDELIEKQSAKNAWTTCIWRYAETHREWRSQRHYRLAP